MAYRREMPPGGGDPDREVREELEFYLEERTREFVASGMDPEEARRAAEEAFGDLGRIQEQVRRINRKATRTGRRRGMLEDFLQDVRFALRSLARRPGFLAVVLATLGLGIGSVTAIFSVVNASMLRALPFADADDLVFVQGAYDAPEGPRIRGASYLEAMDWRERSGSFEAAVPLSGRTLTLTDVDQAERVNGELVGDGYFQALRVAPLLGRFFTAEEHGAPDSHPVAVLGQGLWERAFGGDPDMVGTTVTLNGRTLTVVGVAPESFRGVTLQADVWVPLSMISLLTSPSILESRGSRWLNVVARLRPGLDPRDAQADMDAVARALQAEYPEQHEDRVALVTSMREAYLGSTRTLILVILGAAGLLLAIAAANVTNLLLVRSTTRGPEVVLRRALGAGRRRLLHQLLTESLVLSALGTVVGITVGTWGARALASVMPPTLLPAYVDVSPDLRVFGAAALLMAVLGLVSGLAPALLAARSDVASGLRSGGSRGGRRGQTLVQRSLVVAEVAVALVLLVGAGLVGQGLKAQLAVDPGFDAGSLLAAGVQLPGERYDGEGLRAAARAMVAELERQPGVAAASLGSDGPLRGGSSAGYLWMEGQSRTEDRIRFYRHYVGPGWFQALGIPIRSGRALEAADGQVEPAAVTVISHAFARRHFAGRDPVGRTLTVGAPDGLRLTIVGVAEDVRYRDLVTDLVEGATDPDIFIPWFAMPTSSFDLVVRANGDPAALADDLREAVARVDPDLAVFNAQPMSQGLATQTAQARFGAVLLVTFGALAVLLAAVGLYGVLSFSVGRRTREIAVRMAVGAGGSDVRRLVVIQGMGLAAIGLALGLAGALVGGRALAALDAPSALATVQSLLFQVDPVDLPTYVVVTLFMASVAWVATWVPALRATRVRPQQALKEE